MRLSVLGLVLTLSAALVAAANGALAPELTSRFGTGMDTMLRPLVNAMPFGAALSTPFLAIAAVLAMFFLARMLGWVLSLTGIALVALLLAATLSGSGLGAFLAAAYPWAARGS